MYFLIFFFIMKAMLHATRGLDFHSILRDHLLQLQLQFGCFHQAVKMHIVDLHPAEWMESHTNLLYSDTSDHWTFISDFFCLWHTEQGAGYLFPLRFILVCHLKGRFHVFKNTWARKAKEKRYFLLWEVFVSQRENILLLPSWHATRHSAVAC